VLSLLQISMGFRSNCCLDLTKSSRRSSLPVSPFWQKLSSTILHFLLFSFLFFLSDNLSAHTTVCVTFARGFGPQTLNPKPILKAIPKIFGHADNAVRAEVGLVLRSFFFFFFVERKKLLSCLPSGIQTRCGTPSLAWCCPRHLFDRAEASAGEQAEFEGA